MNRAERRSTLRAARRPPARTVEVTIESGDFEGWYAKARADFRTGALLELESGVVGRILPVLEEIIVEHNMPNGDGEVAEHLADVDPYAGLVALANEITGAIGRLPPR